MWPVLAQNAAEITGWTGWVAFVANGGVMAWLLLRHLPAKDAQIEKIIATKDGQLAAKDQQIKDLVTSCDTHNERVVKEFVTQLQQQRQDFERVLLFVTTQAEKHVATLAGKLSEEFRNIREDIEAQRRADNKAR